MRVALVAMIAAVAVTAIPSSSRADPEATEKAKAEFLRGVEAENAGQLEDALVHYRNSYDFYPRPTALFNMAFIEEQLGDTVAALAHFEQFTQLSLSRRYSKQLKHARERIRVLEDRLAVLVTVTSDPKGAKVYVADSKRSVGRTPLKLKLPPGNNRLRLVHPSRAEARREVEVGIGRDRRFHIVLDRLAASARISSNLADAVITIDGFGVEPSEETVSLRPGRHRIAVRKSGYSGWKGAVTLAAGELVDIDVSLRRKRSTESKLIFGGLLTATLVVAGTSSVLAVKAAVDADTDLATLSDLGGLTAVVLGVAAGTYWYVTSPGSTTAKIKKRSR